jgi:hypothetical protein
MGYPGYGYPGNPHPDQPNISGAYGLTGPELQAHEARERAIAYGANPHALDAQAGEAAFGLGNTAAADAASQQMQAAANQAMFQRGLQGPPMPPTTHRPQLPQPWKPADDTVQRIRDLHQELAGPSSYTTPHSPAQPIPSWIRPWGGVIMVVSGIFIPAAFAYRGPVLLAIPAFLTGLIMFHSRRFTRRR